MTPDPNIGSNEEKRGSQPISQLSDESKNVTLCDESFYDDQFKYFQEICQHIMPKFPKKERNFRNVSKKVVDVLPIPTTFSSNNKMTSPNTLKVVHSLRPSEKST